MRIRGFLALLLLTGCIQAPAQQAWIGTWGASPLPPTPAGGFFPATPGYENVTIRQIVRISAGGDQLRLRLSNEYGSQPLAIGAARVAIADGDEAIVADTERVVRFSGATSAVIPAGSPLLSDPVDLEVGALATLSISLYLPEDTGACTCHQVGLHTGFVSAPGDHTAGTFEPESTMQARAFISGIEVLSGAAGGVIVALGDSITDGVGSSAGANNRWPDVLAERLAARGPAFGVVNQGISGNRVLADGAGESALARLDRDVLSVPGATHVIVFEGVNDLGLGYGSFGGPGGGNALPQSAEVTAESMIAGYRQIIARAHAKGLRVYGATIAPYEGAGYYAAEGERVRQQINAWMRDSGEFDAVLDFDAVLRDPEQPSQIADGLHAGDFLHGSDAGYEAMAQSIDLALFR